MGIDELNAYLVTPVAQIALIIGIAEVIKRLGLKKKYIPLVDLGLGLISGIFVFGNMLGFGMGIGIIMGVMMGLSACGLFSGVKNVTESKEPTDLEEGKG